MYAKLTYENVSRGLSERPCTGDFREAARQLPDWKATAYGPREMAAHGVKHESIIWVFLRPEVLGAAGMVEATCRMAERVLSVFEAENPGDARPRNAIAAARACAADPSDENRRAALEAAEAVALATASESKASWAAEAAWAVAAVAVAAAEATRAAASWALWAAWAAAEAAETEHAAQINIVEAVIKEYVTAKTK